MDERVIKSYKDKTLPKSLLQVNKGAPVHLENEVNEEVLVPGVKEVKTFKSSGGQLGLCRAERR